jgi:hypothetical protein
MSLESGLHLWCPDTGATFQSLNDSLCTAPVLGYSQPEKFTVNTDASHTGIKGVLWQVQKGQEQAAAYFSKTQSRAVNCSVTWWELLATVKALEYFHRYIYSQEFLPVHWSFHHDVVYRVSRNWKDRQPAGSSVCRVQLNIQTSSEVQAHQNQNTLFKTMSRKMQPLPEGEWQAGSLRVKVIAGGAADGWDCATQRRKHLNNHDCRFYTKFYRTMSWKEGHHWT